MNMENMQQAFRNSNAFKSPQQENYNQFEQKTPAQNEKVILLIIKIDLNRKIQNHQWLS